MFDIEGQISELLRLNRMVNKSIVQMFALMCGTLLAIVCIVIDGPMGQTIGIGVAASVGMVSAYLFTKRDTGKDNNA